MFLSFIIWRFIKFLICILPRCQKKKRKKRIMFKVDAISVLIWNAALIIESNGLLRCNKVLWTDIMARICICTEVVYSFFILWNSHLMSINNQWILVTHYLLGYWVRAKRFIFMVLNMFPYWFLDHLHDTKVYSKRTLNIILCSSLNTVFKRSASNSSQK